MRLTTAFHQRTIYVLAQRVHFDLLWSAFVVSARYSNVLHPRAYIERIQQTGAAVAETEEIDRVLEMGETLMLGLRLIEEGVARVRFQDRFGVELDEVYGATIARLIEQGLLESDEERIRLTSQGRLLGNRVFAEFLPDEA
jgi:oxygen-independent coproporphyrinogen-3 oxidase